MERLYSFSVKTVKRYIALLPALFLFGWALRETAPLLFLEAYTTATIEHWELEDGFWGRSHLVAVYSFEHQGVKVFGRTRFKEAVFLNEYAARRFVEQAESEYLVWFDPARPERSTLEKIYPTGLYIRFFIALLIGVYFILLNRYNTADAIRRIGALFRVAR